MVDGVGLAWMRLGGGGPQRVECMGIPVLSAIAMLPFLYTDTSNRRFHAARNSSSGVVNILLYR